MGKDKQTQQTQQTQQTSYQADPSMLAMNRIQLGQMEAADPMQRQVNANAFNVINQLLTGNTAGLPGFLGTLAQGINPQVTQGLVNQSLGDVNVQLAKSGAGTMMESGPSQSIGVRTAGDIRLASEENNLNRLLNLLNIGVGGQAQIQQPILATSSMLGSRLAGLTGMTSNMSGNQTSTAMNPFLRSFQTSMGNSFGTWSGGFGPSGGPLKFGGN